jgi:hypothetical protein
MYHLSRSLYRELAALLPEERGSEERQHLLDACETTLNRLATDPDYFAYPARYLFREVRTMFGFCQQRRVCRIIDVRLTAARAKIEHERALMRRDCGAFTRKGTQCQREAVTGGRYCPSHRHLDPIEEPAAA